MSNTLFHPRCSAFALYSAWIISLPASQADETKVEYLFESYDESDQRIDVLSQYYDLQHRFAQGTHIGARYVIDALSGATPSGTYQQWQGTPDFVHMKDERRSIGLTLGQKSQQHDVTFEFVQSNESDYISNSYALSDSLEMNDKNTVISAGVSYLDDVLRGRPGVTANRVNKGKHSLNLALGVSQILDKDTVIDCNLSYGEAKGYLSDPYKSITQFLDDPLIAGLKNADQFYENRPSERDTASIKCSLRHYFSDVDGALQSSYRLFGDGNGLTSHTVDLTWHQQVTSRWMVSPFVRFYEQTEANYYYPYLLNNITPSNRPSGNRPYYSSDYRLAALQTFHYGFSLDWMISPDFKITGKIEHYKMLGHSDHTPDRLFPSANVIGAGFTYSF